MKVWTRRAQARFLRDATIFATIPVMVATEELAHISLRKDDEPEEVEVIPPPPTVESPRANKEPKPKPLSRRKQELLALANFHITR